MTGRHAMVTLEFKTNATSTDDVLSGTENATAKILTGQLIPTATQIDDRHSTPVSSPSPLS